MIKPLQDRQLNDISRGTIKLEDKDTAPSACFKYIGSNFQRVVQKKDKIPYCDHVIKVFDLTAGQSALTLNPFRNHDRNHIFAPIQSRVIY